MAKREDREPGRAGQRAVGTRWEGSAQELFVGLREWRELHPRASLAEIEAELDRRSGRGAGPAGARLRGPAGQ